MRILQTIQIKRILIILEKRTDSSLKEVKKKKMLLKRIVTKNSYVFTAGISF